MWKPVGRSFCRDKGELWGWGGLVLVRLATRGFPVCVRRIMRIIHEGEWRMSECSTSSRDEMKDGALPYNENKGRDRKDQTTILLVDDRPDICDMLSEALTMKGYRVIISAGGAGWLDHAIQSDDLPALLLLDLSNPPVDAATFLQNLRAHWPAAPPILVMTTSKHIYEQLLAAGEHVLQKPFRVRDCLAEVERVIASHK
jgi:CheY-like chemotaxis protein